jgi:hypothetical protein
MYLATVLLLMFVLPIGSVMLEHFHGATPWMALVGKWFVFWSAGVRLFVAGLRQFLQPRYTSEKIFNNKGDEALALVQELGIANFSTGVVGIASLWKPDFVLPVAIIATIFLGIAGLRHALHRRETAKQTVAMVSDLFVAAALGAYVVMP